MNNMIKREVELFRKNKVSHGAATNISLTACRLACT